ncbi:LysM peptidoglycan-binding domain-containing protein [Cronobacter turicensis]
MEQYTVQKGDSLWKISRRFGVDVNELARINGLHTKAEQHIIQPGQILSLPSKDKNYETHLTLRICDLTWLPLRNAKVRLTFDDKIYEHITDGAGVVAGLLIEDSAKGIKVELQHLNKKEYILIARHKTLPLGTLTLRISSREMVIKGSTSVKQGTQQSSKGQEKEKAKQNDSDSSKNKKIEIQTPAINQTTRTEGGAPTSVSNIGNVSEGLRLPPEAEQYRDYIIEAAKKYNFQPEGLAALIYAESRWKANATNSTGSGAVGLGQFKPNTWLSLCTEPESKVYQFLTGKYGYQKLSYENGKILGQLADGAITEIDKDTVLSLRLNAEYNIDMIGLYDRHGIDSLSKELSSVSSLEPDELVKVAYIVHMNGIFGAYDIIMDGKETPGRGEKIPTENNFLIRLHNNLKDSEKESRFYSIDSSYRTAFVAWMISYVDSIIVPEYYRVEPKGGEYGTKLIIEKLNPNYKVKTDLPPVTATNSQMQNSSLTTASTEGTGENGWHNPLRICRIRTHGLASAASASFNGLRHPANRPAYRHQGLDIEADPGTQIFAVANGRISFIVDPPSGDYGRQLCLIVQVDDLPQEKIDILKINNNITEVYFFYAHLSAIHSGIFVGKNVTSSEILGETGCSGNAEGMTSIALGAHLHFEVRTIARAGVGMANRLDPAPFIDGFNYP